MIRRVVVASLGRPTLFQNVEGFLLELRIWNGVAFLFREMEINEDRLGTRDLVSTSLIVRRSTQRLSEGKKSQM